MSDKFAATSPTAPAHNDDEKDPNNDDDDLLKAYDRLMRSTLVLPDFATSKPSAVATSSTSGHIGRLSEDVEDKETERDTGITMNAKKRKMEKKKLKREQEKVLKAELEAEAQAEVMAGAAMGVEMKQIEGRQPVYCKFIARVMLHMLLVIDRRSSLIPACVDILTVSSTLGTMPFSIMSSSIGLATSIHTTR